MNSSDLNRLILLRRVVRGMAILWIALGIWLSATFVYEWHSATEPMEINGQVATAQEVRNFFFIQVGLTVIGGIIFWIRLRSLAKSIDETRKIPVMEKQ